MLTPIDFLTTLLPWLQYATTSGRLPDCLMGAEFTTRPQPKAQIDETSAYYIACLDQGPDSSLTSPGSSLTETGFPTPLPSLLQQLYFSASLLPLGFLNRVQSYCTCSTASYHRMQDPARPPKSSISPPSRHRNLQVEQTPSHSIRHLTIFPHRQRQLLK
ncbi:hypothetical protein V8E54_008254 [Elaphomyces granulatus]